MQANPRPGWRDVLILVLGYVALDWASYIHPLHGFNITPWNPAPAIGLYFLLQYGRNALLPLALAILMADLWVRNLPAALPVALALSALLTLGYWAIAELLRRRLTSRHIFDDRRALVEWALIVAFGTLLNSAAYVTVLCLGRLIPLDAGVAAFIRYWIGEGVGVLVSMPILWMLLDELRRAQLRAAIAGWESAAYLLSTVVALWVAFGVGAGADFRYFYVLFLPVVWAAARGGLAGAVLSAAVLQVGIIISVQWLGMAAVTILEIQALAAVLALVGFFIGVVVDEQQRVSAELRQTLRLAAAGEMAGALAHELNQPLTALSAFGMACEDMLAQGESGERLRQTIHRMVAESFRAADVVRRLRDFFRTGSTQLEAFGVDELVDSALQPFMQKAPGLGVEMTVALSSSATLLADRLQLEVVLRNLLANAFDAVAGQGAGQRRVWLSVDADGPGRIRLMVEDSGPGFSAADAGRVFEAFHSSKASGLGLGLLISRAIVEAHGGSLHAEVAAHGIVKLLLPLEGRNKNDPRGL